MIRATPAWLTNMRADSTEERLPLDQEVITLGRSEACDVVVSSPTVSRLHARIELHYGRYVLFDADSTNGTFINGQCIQHSQQLSTGDELWLGSPDVRLVFTDPEQTLITRVSSTAPALFIDAAAHRVTLCDSPVQLSPREYAVLLHLATHAGILCTREETFLAVWGHPYDHTTSEDALNACITKLRRNLRLAAESATTAPPTITTVPRIGFRLDANVAFSVPGAQDRRKVSSSKTMYEPGTEHKRSLISSSDSPALSPN